MRLYLNITPNKAIVPFDCQPKLLGTLHKWLGAANIYHDAISIYSLSWLMGGRRKGRGLDFSNGAQMFISSPDGDFLHQLINGVLATPKINYGMEVSTVDMQSIPDFGRKAYFRLANPALVKLKREGQADKHLVEPGRLSAEVLTQVMRSKLKEAGLGHLNIHLRFDEEYPHPKTKLYWEPKRGGGRIGNRTLLCPVIAEGDPEAIAFAYDVGVGHSTGMGFGAVERGTKLHFDSKDLKMERV